MPLHCNVNSFSKRLGIMFEADHYIESKIIELRYKVDELLQSNAPIRHFPIMSTCRLNN